MATWCVKQPPTIFPVIIDGEKFSEILASIAELLYKYCSAQLKSQNDSCPLSLEVNPVSDLTKLRRKRNV